jgi:geranylgeranyl diphosphate synthase type II
VTSTAPVDVEPVLARYSRLTRQEMDRHLPRDGDGRDGGLAPLLRAYPDRSGKGIRPALLLATCRAYGGTVREALGPAAAIELLHNSFLIHDDLEDESELRRGRPTLHQEHGVPLAVNAGDALAVVALAAVHDHSELGARLSQRIMVEILQMAQRTTAGQSLELRWRRDNALDLEPEDYFDLILQKTCCYTTIYPLRIGALVGSRGSLDDDALERISQFGYYLGAAFQIRDDLLNLVGDEHESGKEALGDLREGKRTLMLIHLLQTASAGELAWLSAYLDRAMADRAPDDAARVLRMMEAHGSLEFAETWGRAIAAEAHAAFDGAFADVPPSSHLDFLAGMVPYMLERSR